MTQHFEGRPLRRPSLLEAEAQVDALTGLPDPAHFAALLADAIAASDRDASMLAVCCLDIDHFASINQRFGRAAGDAVLAALAERLRGTLRSGAGWADAAGRPGGDEFMLLLRVPSADEAQRTVERLLEAIAQPCAVDAAQPAAVLSVTASAGISVYPLDRSQGETLLRHAGHALYGAKQSGRNRCLFFDPQSSRRTEARVLAVGRVQEALDGGELELHYQPKLRLRDGQLLGVEALLRWNHPQHGVIAPAQFLPLIERTGLAAGIGQWVLERAIEQLAGWHAMGLDLSVSVNVAARHLQAGDFSERLQALLARYPRPLAGRLELEVLETAALADLDYTCALMLRCRAGGVRFALDDFGTGYSNLTYLKRLPVDVLKIDRSFVGGMLSDADDLAIVQGVISLARSFGCSVVAEGVESAAQWRRLIELGCDIGQGTGIAAPMPAQQLLGWIGGRRTAPLEVEPFAAA